MKSKIRFLLIAMLCLCITSTKAETISWNFSDWTIGDIMSTTTINGLTVAASSDKKVTVDENNKTVTTQAAGEQSYTKRLKLNGTGTATTQNVSFAVTGACTIEVVAQSGNSEDTRTLNICAGSYDKDHPTTTMSIPGVAPVATTYQYTGGATTLYIASANSGINLYAIYVTYPVEQVEQESHFVFRNNNDVTNVTNITVPTDNTVNNVSQRAFQQIRVVDENNNPLAVGADNVTFEISNNSISDLTVGKSVTDASRFAADMRWSANATGVATITMRYAGGTINGTPYKACEASFILIVTKKNQTISWTNDAVTIDYGQSVDNSLNTNPSRSDVTYTSSNTNIATVNASGQITVVNAGSCTITASVPETDTYAAASAEFALTVNPTGADYMLAFENDTEDIPLGNYSINNIICTDPDLQFAIRISNESVAVADQQNPILTGPKANIMTKYIGTTTVTVYPTNLNGKPYHEASYTLNVTKGHFNMAFNPQQGTINAGSTVTPLIYLPTIYLEHITSITATSADPNIASVPSNLLVKPYYNEQGVEYGMHRIDGINPVITGVSEGTTTITVYFVSEAYESCSATYTITVNAAGTNDFKWVDNTPIYFYQNDYIMMPDITGSFSGNNHDSNYNHYLYGIMPDGTHEISSSTYQKSSSDQNAPGVPDFSIESTGDGGEALIFLVDGRSAREGRLFIFGKSPGTVKLVATDAQDSSKKIERILTIWPVSDINSQIEEQRSEMTLPYTWDFTKPIDTSDLNVSYWVDDNRYADDFDVTDVENTRKTYNYYTLGIGTALNFNYDNHVKPADYNNPQVVSQLQPGVGQGAGRYYTTNIFRNFVGRNEVMAEFAGMKIALGNTSGNWYNKRDRLRIYKEIREGGYLYLIGGPHTFLLPVPEAKATDKLNGQTIKLFLKLWSQGQREVWIKTINANNELSDITGRTTVTEGENIVSWDIVLDGNTKFVQLVLDGGQFSVHWIGYSTQAKSITGNFGNYATYAYPWDLDLDKTKEANTTLTDAYACVPATHTSISTTPLSTAVAGEGMLLEGSATNYYFIATGHNTENYSCTTTSNSGSSVSNQLIGNVGSAPISLTGIGMESYKSGDLDYILAAGGKRWSDSSDIDDQVGFYVASTGATVPVFGAYLHMSEADIQKGNDGVFYIGENYNVDGIADLDRKTANEGAFYNLKGVRVNKPGKGIYIHNGKKVVLK